MDAILASRRYFDAWMRRDAGAVLETLAPGGTYEDPATAGPLAGEALRAYLHGLWAAFPDLTFELGRVQAQDAHTVHGQWTMLGTNTGSLHGLPPTGKAVRLPGIDVIDVAADGIRRVTGYFDSAALPRQLGLDVIVQPREVGPFRLGAGSVVRRDRATLPGAIGVTELVASSDDAIQSIRQLAREITGEQLQEPGFQAFTGTVVGRRLVTLSAWDSAQTLQAAMRRGTHAQAMRRFFEDGIAEGGYTGVFVPQRVGPFWRRCHGCGRMARLAEPTGRCDCGASLQALP